MLLEVYRQTYNYFLTQWNGKDKIPSRPELKREKEGIAEITNDSGFASAC